MGTAKSAWYCLIDGQEYGPYPGEQIKRFVREGRLTEEDLVRTGTDTEWTPATEIPGLFPEEPREPPSAAPAPDQPRTAASPPPPARAVVSEPSQSVPPLAPPVASPAAPPAGGRGKGALRRQYAVAAGLSVALLALAAGAIAYLGRGLTPVATTKGAAGRSSHGAAPSAEAGPPDRRAAPAADAESNPGIAPAGASDQPPGPAVLPPVKKWFDASRGTVRLVRSGAMFRVDHVWLESGSSEPPDLHVVLTVSNGSSREWLDYQTWSSTAGQGGSYELFLVDDQGKRLALVSDPTAPPPGQPVTHRLAPRGSVTDHLVFESPSSGFQSFRLALPYAVIGRTGHVGFEIPSVMVKDHPPVAPEVRQRDDAHERAAGNAPEGPMGDGPSAADEQPSALEPDSFEALRSAIQQSVEGGEQPEEGHRER